MNITRENLIELIREDEEIRNILLDLVYENLTLEMGTEEVFQYCEDSSYISVSVNINLGENRIISDYVSF